MIRLKIYKGDNIMELYYENEGKKHSQRLNMPNQFLMMDCTEMTPLQALSILYLLHNSQVEIHNLTYDSVEKLYDHEFKIDIYKLKMFSNMKSANKTNLHYIADELKKLQMKTFQSLDVKSFNSFVILPNIRVEAENSENIYLYYKLNTEVIKIIHSKNNGIIDEKNNFKVGNAYYTPIYLDLLKETGLSKKSEVALYKLLLCLSTYFINRNSITIYYSIEDFKKILGIKAYKTGESLVNEIKTLFNDVEKHANITCEYDFEYGNRNVITKIKLKSKYKNPKDEDLAYISYCKKVEQYEDDIREHNEMLEIYNSNDKIKDKKVSSKKTTSTSTKLKSNPQKSDLNPFSSEMNLGYKLIKQQNSFECFYSLLKHAQISADINKSTTYHEYSEKIEDYFKEEYFKHKVSEKEFNSGYRFRKYTIKNDEITDEQVSEML